MLLLDARAPGSPFALLIRDSDTPKSVVNAFVHTGESAAYIVPCLSVTIGTRSVILEPPGAKRHRQPGAV